MKNYNQDVLKISKYNDETLERKEEKTEKTEQEKVDQIFQEADNEISNCTLNTRTTLKPQKSIKKRIQNYGRWILVSVLVVFVAMVVFGIYGLKTMIPQVKSEMANNLIALINQFEEIDDNQLTEEEQYQKKIMTAMSEEDVRNAVEKINIMDMIGILNQKSIVLEDLLDEETLKRIEQIQEEYDQHKQSVEDSENDNIPTKESETSEGDLNFDR